MELFIALVKEGYEIRLMPARTKTGLYHPRSLDSCSLRVEKPLPGVNKGSMFAWAKVTYDLLRDPHTLSEALLDLKTKVDKLTDDK